MKTFKGRTSKTKNWPGGRKNSTVLTTLSKTSSVPLWNKSIVGTKKPYLQKEQANEVVITDPISTSSNDVDVIADTPQDQV